MNVTLLHGDCLEMLRGLDAGSARTCVTSPPYFGLRDYGSEGQIGLEPTPDAYVARLVEVFREVRRVLADDGTLWLNLGDSYAAGKQGRTDADRDFGSGRGGNKLGSGNPGGGVVRKVPEGCKPKDLLGIPWRVAFALQADGWYLRSDCIWHKPNAMPESVRDRPTKAHEYLFLLSKRDRYYYDADAVKECATYAETRTGRVGQYQKRAMYGNGDGTTPTGAAIRDLSTRNRRTVWSIPTKPYSGAHFAVMPEALVEPCILAGSAAGDTVLDLFAGSGTVGAVAVRHGRKFVGIDLNAAYLDLARERIAAVQTRLL